MLILTGLVRAIFGPRLYGYALTGLMGLAVLGWGMAESEAKHSSPREQAKFQAAKTRLAGSCLLM